MHHGRGAAGFSATGPRDSIGASTRGPHRTWFVFVGHRNKALDSGSPFVEFPRSGRKIEEQLLAHQGLCWRRRQRNLHGLRSASTSDHVRRSSITIPRSHAVFTSASVSGQVFYVPGVALGALPAVTPGIFGVITPFVARCLGGARCWSWRGSLGGPCVAFGWGGDDLGSPAPPTKGLASPLDLATCGPLPGAQTSPPPKLRLMGWCWSSRAAPRVLSVTGPLLAEGHRPAPHLRRRLPPALWPSLAPAAPRRPPCIPLHAPVRQCLPPRRPSPPAVAGCTA